MRTDKVHSGTTAAVAGLVGILVIFLAGTAIAAPRGIRTEARPVALADSGRAVAGTDGAVENAAKCGKCHSTCENGRIHLGAVPTGMALQGVLPLGSDGRTTCLTCHDSHGDQTAGAPGHRLRMSILRRELCLACHGPEREGAPSVEIMAPLEGVVVEDARLAFIGRAAGLSGDLLTVRINGAEFHLHVKDGGFSTWLTLREGVNLVEVAEQERLLWRGEIFHVQNAVDGYERTSSGHRTGNREQCSECHLKKVEMSAGITGAAKALCYGCHDRIDEKRFVHGPLAVGDCLACHDPHGGYGSAHLRKEQKLLCRNCHGPQGDLGKTACGSGRKACIACHDPHQSDARYLLKRPQYTLRGVFDQR